jgi:hypothetical protein
MVAYKSSLIHMKERIRGYEDAIEILILIVIIYQIKKTMMRTNLFCYKTGESRFLASLGHWLSFFIIQTLTTLVIVFLSISCNSASRKPVSKAGSSASQDSGSCGFCEVKLSDKGSSQASAWDLMLLDAAPAGVGETGSTAVGDIDGDGKQEIVIGGVGAMLWYRPSTFEKGLVAKGHFHCGVALMDIDGDGQKDIVAGHIMAGSNPETFALYWYKTPKDLNKPFTEYVIDPEKGGPHDVLVADLDGDGKNEVIANAMYIDNPALYAYKPGPDVTKPWKKQVIQIGLTAEGTVAGYLEGNGQMDIISGPYWFSPPAAGPFSGQLWQKHTLATGFREMCRDAVIDVNGDGRPDVVIVEDEYPDGRFSWFENRIGVDTKHPWVEHSIPVEGHLNFAHSLQAWRDAKTGGVNVFVGEMNAGGWGAPYNLDARLMKFVFSDNGQSVSRELLYQGEGTHQAVVADVDGDGVPEIVGHSAQVVYTQYPDDIGWVQVFKQQQGPQPFKNYHHEFIDREKPSTGTDITWVDVDGDGLSDIVCGSWWYKNPGWERHQIPGIVQVINAYDIDKDGRKELIAMKGKPGVTDWYGQLSSELCWLKPIDPLHDKWEEHRIGAGSGDWPHGSAIGAFLPGGRLALITGYHNHDVPPEIFEIPDNPASSPWTRRILANIPYGEEMVPYDLDGDGLLDVVAGPFWLENMDNGQFAPHLLVDGYEKVARTAIADINGDGKPDIVVSEENVDWSVQRSYFARVSWFENTGDPRHKGFIPHVVDRIYCPHSLSVGDLDGDGKPEIVAAEHNPFKPYRSRGRLFAYKLADSKGTAWYRYTLDDRFEHHDGAKVVELNPGKLGIISHSWMEPHYVHLWRLN